jgi:DhnA-type fructose-1,6-bisphosphate aldolase and related enzymes
MPNIGKEIRISRFLKSDGHTLISALDHGGEDALVKGLENMGKVLDSVIKGGVDAVLINEGTLLRYYKIIVGRCSRCA